MRSLLLAVVALCAVLVTSSAFAVERPLLAVLDFTGKQAKLSTAEAQALTGIARKQALEVLGKRFALITRENLVDLLKSHGKTLEKCQGECETETGRLIGAEVVVSGHVTKVFGAYRLEIKAHRTSPPELLAFEEATTKKRGDLPDVVKSASKALFDKMKGGPHGVPEEKKAAPREVRSPAAKSRGEVTTGFVRIKGGHARLGSSSRVAGRDDDEGPLHTVSIRSFELQSTEVTQGQWRALMKTNPSHFSACGDACPVENVSWWDALAYLNTLSKKEGHLACYTLTGCTGQPGDGSYECSGVKVNAGAGAGNPLYCTGYRLPTESEWEFAARSGVGTGGHRYVDDIAWYSDNAERKTHPVGTKRESRWGHHDMLGNVWEWTWDWYAREYTRDVMFMYAGPSRGEYRVYRGGSFSTRRLGTRVARRRSAGMERRFKDVGFRPARTLPK